MATITTELDDLGEVLMLMECETSGAFSKSSSEIKANPGMAFKNSVNAIGLMCRTIGEKVGQNVEGTGLAFECVFGIKVDAAGGVMIAANPGNSQFQVTVKYTDDEDYE